jgi:hypothetical protein
MKLSDNRLELYIKKEEHNNFYLKQFRAALKLGHTVNTYVENNRISSDTNIRHSYKFLLKNRPDPQELQYLQTDGTLQLPPGRADHVGQLCLLVAGQVSCHYKKTHYFRVVDPD